ncbi:MAG TPA: acyl-ACP--UDP-N-acetylglucosamine O-acyltransferase [Burkholderiales bacterium]|nr:acyl-ACP--UDP-N-acetylglucosamine O-acyltransferase [Burkholderiales bacterium]
MIHSTALVDPGARLAGDVEVGPYAIVGPHVELGPGCRVGPHAVVTGHTRIGRNTRIFQFASVGEAPQDKKYKGEPTRLEMGEGNVVREFVTLNVGTAAGGGVTRIGDDNLFMAYAHVAHDCEIGSHTVFANNATLGGHVSIGDHAILGGFTAVHQFCKIGAHVITAGGSLIAQDVPPYLMVGGSFAGAHGLNSEGLRRRGFSPEGIAALKRAYKIVYRSGLTLEEAKRALAELAAAVPEVAQFREFLARSERGIIR